MSQYDVVIIGGGPAGTACALDLASHKKKVALIEKDEIGGVCLNRGCIPSKTYLYLTELLGNINKAKRHGIEVGEPKVIWEDAKKRKDMNVKMLAMGLTKTLQEKGVEIIKGEGILKSATEVTIKKADGEELVITAPNIVLAVGSKAMFLPFTIPGEHVIPAGKLLDVPEIPKTLTIIGGGVTGVEMASMFSELGSKVTIIELQNQLLPGQDKELATHLKNSLEKKGCEIILQAAVTSAKDNNGQAEIIYKDITTDAVAEEKVINSDKALVVIGRQTSYDLNHLANIGLKNDGKRLVLNENLQSTLPNVYVIGDAAFNNLTAYGAEREGEVAAAHIMGESMTINYAQIPITVFSHPEVASIGLTEEAALTKNLEFNVLKSAYAANAKAVIAGEREGFVKIITDKNTDKILGVHIIGWQASELIHQAVAALSQEVTASGWKSMVWSHPVLSEVLKSALSAS